MKIDEITLRAYVDGELSPDERQRVDAILSNNDALKAQADALQASRLPYRAAFDAQPLPPMPAALAQQLANLSAAASVAPAPELLATRGSDRRWLAWLGGGLAVAASFAAGVMVNAVWFDAVGQREEALAAQNSLVAKQPPWVHAIANYQAMYVRDTVGRTTDGVDQAHRVLRQFETKASTKLAVPDLASAGLAFKRIQMLGFGDRQLVQMVYLPSAGKPAALCVLRFDDLKDAPVTAQRMENLSIVTWQKDKLAYVLALDMPLPQAIALGKKLGASEFPILHRV
jgi:anti-sigma factor RsiW